MTTTKNELPADADSAVIIQNSAATKVVHWGSKFGTACGTGYNRRGGRPIVTRVDAPVTCSKKACASHA